MKLGTVWVSRYPKGTEVVDVYEVSSENEQLTVAELPLSRDYWSDLNRLKEAGFVVTFVGSFGRENASSKTLQKLPRWDFQVNLGGIDAAALLRDAA